MSVIHSSSAITLPRPPSCLAFSQIHPAYLIIGTYYLEQDGKENDTRSGVQKRSGSLILLEIDEYQLIECQTIPCPSGILDLVFSPHDRSIFCTATSTGSLIFYRLSFPPEATLSRVLEAQVFDPSTLVLDLEFHPTDDSIIGATLSTGETVLISLPPSSYDHRLSSHLDSTKPAVQIIHTSSLEAWTLAFSPCGSHIFFGSDDASLGIADLLPTTPSSTAHSTLPSPNNVSIIRKTHAAGVTCILPLTPTTSKRRNHVLLTGSYDDHLRVVRPDRKLSARVVGEIDLCGGVWRVKLLSYHAEGNTRTWKILAACMYAGARVVRVRCADWQQTLEGNEADDGGWTLEVLGRFEEHESMCYGIDVQPIAEQAGQDESLERTVVSSSFYDRKVCVWRVMV